MSLYPNIDHLDTLTFGGLKNGVQIMRKLLKKLGNPQNTYKVFHVAGTNGKGSTCQMLSQVLWKEFGYKVGLTTSPHLIKLNERIQINGMFISNETLNTYLHTIFTFATQEQVHLSFFESIIMVALLYFRDQQVDYAVIEVGLGGKYDATNVFSSPLATLITTISDDHRHLLGPSLTQIFRNKAGILKKSVPCFTRLDTPLMERASKVKKAPLYTTKKLVPTNLHGIHQQQNAGLAFHCLTTIGLDADHVKHGLMHITHPGRTQRLSRNILIDGAHNEEGVHVFSHYLHTISHRFKKIVTIFGTTKTREEYPLFFAQLIKGDINYLVKPAIEHRSVDPITYQAHLTFSTTYGSTLTHIWDQLPRNEPATLIVIYGSLYLVGEFLEKYEQHGHDQDNLLEKKQ